MFLCGDLNFSLGLQGAGFGVSWHISNEYDRLGWPRNTPAAKASQAAGSVGVRYDDDDDVVAPTSDRTSTLNTR